MAFSRQEYWSRLPFPSPEEPQRWSPASQADSLPFDADTTSYRSQFETTDIEKVEMRLG